MLNISGKNVRLWRNEREGRNGKFFTYSIGISKKVDDKYINKSVKVRLVKDAEPVGTIPNGVTIDFEGFPTVDIYTDKDGHEHRDVMIVIQKINVHDEDYFEASEEAIPF